MSSRLGFVPRAARPARSRRARWLLLLALPGIAGCAVVEEPGIVVSSGPISDRWDVQWNPTLGTPSTITNRSLEDVTVSRTTPAIADSTAEKAVRAVLRDHTEWFQLRPGLDELVVVGSRAAEWLRHLRFQQYYRGLPVAGAGYEARVFPSGRVWSLQGRYHPDIELLVTPRVDENLAESRARGLLINGTFPPEVPVVRFEAELERVLRGNRALAIVPWGQGLALAWAIMVENGPRERARVYIHAETGEVIGRQPIAGTWMH